MVPPAAWTFSTFDPSSSTSACPAGYDSPIVVEQVTQPTSTMCTCMCGGPPSTLCSVGTGSMSFEDQDTTACILNVISFTSDGSCDAFPAGAIGKSPLNHTFTSALVNPVPLPNTPTACTGGTAQLPPFTTTPGRVCTPSASCAGGGSCVASAPTGQSCVQASGDGDQCPSGYGTQYVVYTSSDVHDDRTCGTCACTSNATSCVNPMLKTYNGAGCNGAGDPVQTDGKCDSLMSGEDLSNDDHFKYSAQPNVMTCSAPNNGMVAVSNQIMLPTPLTICCH
jgi:hypothetical protein